MLKNVKKQAIFIVIMLLLLLTIGCIKSNMPNQKIKIFGFSIWIVDSGSMQPTLKIGDAIIIKEQPEYQKDDIITYQVEEKYYVTHRIIEKTNEGYITKGDFNNIEDKGRILPETIEGKVVFHSTILGYIIQYSWILIILLFLMIILMI